jgi:hypothetical protein
MTRKDYTAMAKMVYNALARAEKKSLNAEYAIRYMVDDLCVYLASDNERFDRNKFLAKCGLSEMVSND